MHVDNDNRAKWVDAAIQEVASATLATIKCDVHYIEDHSSVSYTDDMVVGYCSRCGVRITMDRIPGTMAYLRVRGLVAALASGDRSDALIAEFHFVKKQIRDDIRQAKVATQFLAMAERMIEGRDAIEED